MTEPQFDPNRRRSGRIIQESLMCNLGEVLDLSKGGMRVHRKRLHDLGSGRVEIIFHGLALPSKLYATEVWTQNRDDGGHETGLHFVDLTEEQVDLLSEIGRQFSFNRVL